LGELRYVIGVRKMCFGAFCNLFSSDAKRLSAGRLFQAVGLARTLQLLWSMELRSASSSPSPLRPWFSAVQLSLAQRFKLQTCLPLYFYYLTLQCAAGLPKNFSESKAFSYLDADFELSGNGVTAAGMWKKL